MILQAPDRESRDVLVNAIGRKWEFTFTMLVVFGGAFFASFPLFYSTSFGGAYWLWMLILAGFVLQAVSYEFRRRRGNIYGTMTYDTILTLHGLVSPVLLGFTVLFLARVLALLFVMKTTRVSEKFSAWCRRRLLINSVIFVVLFLAFVAVLLTTEGLMTVSEHEFVAVKNKYLLNLLEMWWVAVVLLIGVVLVLVGIIRPLLCKGYSNGIWFTGIGTVLVVMALFWIAGYNDTPYYPSLLDVSSSLTIRNSSSSLFTLRVMSVVSLVIPVVAAYMIYAWYSLTRKPVTPEELAEKDHQY